MIEDELLKLRFKYGSQEALWRIYEKYLNYLLTLAMALSHNASDAEDVVHDVFVSFAKSAEDFKLTGSLKSYLATSVINRVRDRARRSRRQLIKTDKAELINSNSPEQSLIFTEQSKLLNHAISQVPDQQREVLVLRLVGQMKFKEIARLQGVSVNTIQGRYRYGLDKLRSLLNGEVVK